MMSSTSLSTNRVPTRILDLCFGETRSDESAITPNCGGGVCKSWVCVSDITEMNPDFDWLRREGMSQLLYVTVVCVQVITLLYVTVHVSTR